MTSQNHQHTRSIWVCPEAKELASHPRSLRHHHHHPLLLLHNHSHPRVQFAELCYVFLPCAISKRTEKHPQAACEVTHREANQSFPLLSAWRAESGERRAESVGLRMEEDGANSAHSSLFQTRHCRSRSRSRSVTQFCMKTLTFLESEE